MSSWSAEFKKALRKYGRVGYPTPVIRVESFTMWPGGADSTRTGGIAISSAPLDGGGMGVPVITSVRIAGGRVTARAWTSSIDDIEVGVTLEHANRWVKGIQIGETVKILMGFAGWSPDAYEVISFGSIRNFRVENDSNAVLEIGGPLSLLGARWDDAIDQHGLNSGRASSTLNANYTPGDATFTVVSTVGFERQDGETYMVRVIPTTGEEFLMRCSSKTLTVWTVDAGGAGALGTTAVAAVVGDTVTEVLFVPQHPIDAALAILLSTGTVGRNDPTYDNLPTLWSLGIPRDYVRIDVEPWKGKTTPASGSADWQFHATQPQADVYEWLAPALAEGGFFLAVAEGKIAVRAILDPHVNWTTGRTLDLRDVFSFKIEFADTECITEYDRLLVTSYDAAETYSSSDTSETMPAERWSEIELTHVFANLSAWRTEIADRLAPFFTRIPMILEVECAAEWADLGSGDVIHVNCAQQFGVQGRTRSTSNVDWIDVPATVTQTGWDPLTGIVTLRMLILPGQ